MRSDGTPWRPLVHVRDVCRVAAAALVAPRERVHNEAINVGRTDQNLRISEVAEIVKAAIPGTEITFADDAGPDLRCYRVDCSKLLDLLPEAAPQMTVADGVAELLAWFNTYGLAEGAIDGSQFTRLRRIDELAAAGSIDNDLRWIG
jgi:nucleoside-diphosphate-sugar epimerase